MAAPVVESVATSTSSSSANPTAVFTKPSGVAEGDVLLVLLGIGRERALPVSPPSDWELLEADTFTRSPVSVEYGCVYVAYKVAGGSEPSSYTFTFADTSIHVGGMLRISGADAASIVTALYQGPYGSDTSLDAPSVNAPAADSLLITFIAGGVSNDAPFSSPVSEVFDLASNTNNTSQVTASGVAGAEVVAAGATGTRTYTATANSRSHIGVSIAIAPAAGGSTDALTANDVESASEVSSPAIGQTHALTADDVEAASEVTSPAVGQVHALTADDVESASEVTEPEIGQVHALLANDVASASEVSAPSLGQVHALTADDVESASEVSSPALDAEGEEPEPEPEPEEEPRREVSWPWRPNRYAVEREEEARRYQEARKAEEAAERALEARRKALARAEKAVTRIERGLLASEPSLSPPPDRLAALAKARERVKAAEQALRLAEQSMTEARIRAEDEEIALLLLLAA